MTSAPIGAGMIAVEATAEQYFGLKHMPGGLSLDKDGKGIWPADQFTFRLIGEGALREPPADVPQAESRTADKPRKTKGEPEAPDAGDA